MMGSNAQQAPLCRLRQVISDPPHTCSKWIHGGFRTDICFILRLTLNFLNNLKLCYCQKLRFVYRTRTVLFSRLRNSSFYFWHFHAIFVLFQMNDFEESVLLSFIFKHFSAYFIFNHKQKCKPESYQIYIQKSGSYESVTCELYAKIKPYAAEKVFSLSSKVHQVNQPQNLVQSLRFEIYAFLAFLLILNSLKMRKNSISFHNSFE